MGSVTSFFQPFANLVGTARYSGNIKSSTHRFEGQTHRSFSDLLSALPSQMLFGRPILPDRDHFVSARRSIEPHQPLSDYLLV